MRCRGKTSSQVWFEDIYQLPSAHPAIVSSVWHEIIINHPIHLLVRQQEIPPKEC